MSRKLAFEDVLCPICSTILIEPVALPCRHTVCRLCLEKSVDNNTLTCPICRKRIGSFLRSKRTTGKLIDQQLWKEMKEQFETEIQLKQTRKSTVTKILVGKTPGKQDIYKTHYVELLKQLNPDEDKIPQLMRRNLGDEKSKISGNGPKADLILIKNFFLPEKQARNPSGPLCANLKERNDNLQGNCSGRDSIGAELRHFTPIAVVPRTPPKRLPNGKMQEAKLFRPKNILLVKEKADLASLRRGSVQGSLRVTSRNFVPTRVEDEDVKAMDMLDQERRDFELALKLHNEWNSARAEKRSHSYMLRSGKKFRR